MRWTKFVGALTLAWACFSGAQGAGTSNGKAMGNPQAPIRIDLYSDFQCPSCKVFHDRTMGQLVHDYVVPGKVYLVRHEFPLPMHAHAKEASCIASAAEKIGKYELVGEELFRTQDTWAKSGDVVGAACSVLSAPDAKKLRELAKSPAILAEVESDVKLGQGEHVNGTPTMIITRVVRRFPVSGPVSFAVLSKFLDSLMQ